MVPPLTRGQITALTPCRYDDGYISLTEGLTAEQEEAEIEAIGGDYFVIERDLQGWFGNCVIRTSSGATYVADIDFSRDPS